MLNVRRSADRGHADHGWLDARHTFSFGGYYDPAHLGFRALRVMNEDRVQPGQGFGTHGHKDMEIVTCVLEGELEHKDSMGNGAVLRPGEWQRITAGTGIRHSEFNPSAKEGVHLYQIWLLPERPNLEPGYEQKRFEPSPHGWRVVASRDGRQGSLTIHQDATLSTATLAAGGSVAYDLASGRHAWLQVLRGEVQLNDISLAAGDGAALSDERSLTLKAEQNAELLLFDLA